ETERTVVVKYHEQYRLFPSPPKKQVKKITNKLESTEQNFSEKYPIYLFGTHVATLYMLIESGNVTLFEELALKRCGEILSQYFSKHHQQKEAEQLKRNEWILHAIAGKLIHEEITSKILIDTPGIHLKEAIIAVKPIQHSLLRKDANTINSETVLMMLLRSTLHEYGFHLMTVRDQYRDNNFILLLINQQSSNISKRLEQALQTAHEKSNDRMLQTQLKLISFG